MQIMNVSCQLYRNLAIDIYWNCVDVSPNL